MLDEKVQKASHIEHRKPQEQYQKMLSNAAVKVPSAEHAHGDWHNTHDGNLLEGKKDLSILPVIHLV
jgi:hypothetical protein